MSRPRAFFGLLLVLFVGPAGAETVKDREGAVREDKAKFETYSRWNYNDIDAGFRKATETGKPLLVVLRCVPCLACVGIDASVLEEKELAPLLDQYICVRVINANALDLARFQFDYDLSFSALLFNGDGTVYGRFGSWQHQKDPLNKTTAGFKKALEAGLALHKGYPGNKALLAGKQGEPTPYKTPIEFPSLSEKYPSKLDWGGKVVQSCVHCHMIGDAYRAYYRQETKVVPAEWICPQPSIETLGVTLATDDAARVEAVAPGSAGAAAGLQVGDTLLTLNAQPLISIADVSWVLHRAPESGRLPATVQRGGSEVAVSLELPAGWRSKSDISKRVGTWPMRAMAFGGLKMADLDDAGRASAGLTPEGMALRVEHVGEYGAHAAAKKEGFKAKDVLLQVGDEKGRLSESALIGWLLQTHRPGEKLPVVVLRGSERLTLQLPQQ